MLKDKCTAQNLQKANLVLLFILLLLDFSSLLGLSDSVISFLTVMIGFLFMLSHGYLSLGLRNIIAFVIITWVISFSAEALGVATGYVFGEYYYTGHLGPKILGVPLLIQASYAAMGYACLMTGRLILQINKPSHTRSLFFATLVSALLMVGWDVCMDPYQSTVFGDWIWINAGPYFGVSLHNYVGWFVTVFSFLLVYQVYAAYYPEQRIETPNKLLLSQPLIYYVIMALAFILVPWIGGVSDPIASAANYTGSLRELTYSLAIITIFVMGVPAIIALANLFNEDRYN